LQILAFDMGGDVDSSPNREFGYARLKVVDDGSLLFKELPSEMDVWMSHGDQVTSVPAGFRVTALTDEHNRVVQSEKVVEIVKGADGKVVRTGDQFGVGRKK